MERVIIQISGHFAKDRSLSNPIIAVFEFRRSTPASRAEVVRRREGISPRSPFNCPSLKSHSLTLARIGLAGARPTVQGRILVAGRVEMVPVEEEPLSGCVAVCECVCRQIRSDVADVTRNSWQQQQQQEKKNFVGPSAFVGGRRPAKQAETRNCGP